MKKIFALEGLPCAGKTFFLNEFKKNYPEFECVPELYISAPKGSNSIDTRAKYIEAEVNRFQKYKNLETNIIFDRTFLSTLGFSYAKLKAFNEADDYETNLEVVRSGHVIIPDCIFIFDIGVETSIRRRQQLIRDDALEFWTNEVFLTSFSDYYKSSDFQELTKNKQVFSIDTEKLSENQTYNTVCKIIDTVLSVKTWA